MNYYEKHIGDYKKQTGHLTLAEHGAYELLLMLYYEREAPLPLERGVLYRLLNARSKADRLAVDTVLQEFFFEQKDGWHKNRCDEEIARFQEKSGKAKASANARWNKSERNANAMRTHQERISESNADDMLTRHQTPDTNPQTPDTKQTISASLRSQSELPAVDIPIPKDASSDNRGEEVQRARAKKNTPAETEKSQSVSRETWNAYAEAYLRRYGTEPVRNGTVNGQIAHLVKRLGGEAPAVAAWYVGHSAAYYVKVAHSVGAMLRDAEALRTQWATQKRITDTSARKADQTQSNGQAFGNLLKGAA